MTWHENLLMELDEKVHPQTSEDGQVDGELELNEQDIDRTDHYPQVQIC